MLKLNTVTSDSWVVKTPEQEVIGILTKTPGYYSLMINGARYRFGDKASLQKYFNGALNGVSEKFSVNAVSNFVAGYPVSHQTMFAPEQGIHSLPVYRKAETSTTLYAAGYYCVKFPNGWAPAYCPRVSTLENFGYVGPYSQKKAMREQLSLLRKGSRGKDAAGS